jgi:hypothetical protein
MWRRGKTAGQLEMVRPEASNRSRIIVSGSVASVWLPIPHGAEAGPSAVGSNRSTQRQRAIRSALRWWHANVLGRRDVIAILGSGVEHEGSQKFCPMMTRMASQHAGCGPLLNVDRRRHLPL